MAMTATRSAQPLTLVIPTFNETQTIKQAILAAKDGLGDVEHEIIVVDDSPDGATAAVADELRMRSVETIVREDECGLSSAVLRGFDAAEGDILAVMDGDLQHPPRTVANLHARVRDGADVAIGSRHADGGGVDGDWPAWRRVVSWGASALAWSAVPPARQTTDPMSGLFAIDGELVAAARDRLRPSGYKILLELLARCPVERIEEVPYTFCERAAGESNLGAGEYVRYVQHLSRLTIPSRRDGVPRPDVEVDDEPA